MILKKVLFLILLLIVAMATIAFYKNKPTVTISTKTLPSLHEANVSTKKVVSNISPKENIQPQRIFQEQEEVQEDHIKELTSKEENMLYETLSIDEAKLTTKPRKNILPIEAINLQYANIGTLQINDTITLPNIEGVDYTLTISSTQTHTDG